ncbi:hypothetical protein EJ110_NYTH60339 [Nymphaea thermarum]|nr:hypothetical protein EJ110_NYTH60339 [Nymphaea thermarum]
MAMQPPIFSGGGSHDKAKDWIEEVERIFRLLKVPEEDRVNYGSYLLKGDAKNWWQSTSEIRFAGQESITWKQYKDSFFNTYFPVYARDKKMQEFLDLQQNQSSLEEYITRYRHLEAFTMARCIEEDWVRTQKDHLKKTGQPSQGGRTQVKRQHFAGRTRPYERRDDRTFRQNQPTRSEATQGSVATPTSQKCPTCSRVHPEEPCYRVSAEKKKAEVVQAEATEVVPAVSGSAGGETPVLADPGQQTEQMATLTSYWGGFGFRLYSTGASCFGFY